MATIIPRAAAAAAAAATEAITAFDPRNQTFYIAGPNGVTDIAIAMSTIEAQRIRLANVAINYGCQLGLTLMSLIVVLLLLPTSRLRRPLHCVQLSALVVAVIRLCLLVLYFPGPLAGFYVSWTHDARPLSAGDYAANTTSNACGVVQLALVEAALVLQARAMMRTWTWGPAPSPSTSSGVAQWTARLLLILSVALAAATVAMRGVWVAQHTILLRGPVLPTLPLPLTRSGEAAVALSAASIFFFCGLFFAHLSLHLAATRGVLAGASSSGSGRGGRGRGRRRFFRRRRALSSLEILAIGNGVLMLAPSLFAGLDIAAGLGNNRVLPFDAGSWVQTLTVSGLPLIGIVAYYRGVNTRSSSRAMSLFAAAHPDLNGIDEEAAAAYAGSAAGTASLDSSSAWRRRSRWEYHDGRAASASLRRSSAGGGGGGGGRSRSRAAAGEDEDTDDMTMVGGSSSLGGGGNRGRNNSSTMTKDLRNSGSTQGSQQQHPQHNNHHHHHLDLYNNYDYAEKNDRNTRYSGDGNTDRDADADATRTDTEASYESASEKRGLGREDEDEDETEEGASNDDDEETRRRGSSDSVTGTGTAEARTSPAGAGARAGREWI